MELQKQFGGVQTDIIADYLARAFEIITLNFVSNEEEFQQAQFANSLSDEQLLKYKTSEQQVQQEKQQQEEQQQDDDEIQAVKVKKTESSQYKLDKPEVLKKDLLVKGINPIYTHQIFGDEEQISGYKDLRIDIYFTSGRLYPYINVTYTDKLDDADNFMEKFDQWFFSSYTTKVNEFKENLKNEQHFQPTGNSIGSYEINNEKFTVYKSDNKCEGFNELRLYSWPMILFNIEVASYCHLDDYWVYYTVYKQLPNNQQVFVGILTLTEFHVDLNYKRNRISQVFIFPQYQRKGHACKLTEIVYNNCISDPFCLQITVEDCSPEFQAVRDLVETKLVMDNKYFPWMETILQNSLQIPQAIMDIKEDKEIFDKIKKNIKITTAQVHRVFEILLLSKIDKRNFKLLELYKNRVIKRIKQSMEQPKRKLPHLIFEGEKINFNVEQITELQNKQFNQEQYYSKAADSTLDEYKPILKKLNLLE